MFKVIVYNGNHIEEVHDIGNREDSAVRLYNNLLQRGEIAALYCKGKLVDTNNFDLPVELVVLG